MCLILIPDPVHPFKGATLKDKWPTVEVWPPRPWSDTSLALETDTFKTFWLTRKRQRSFISTLVWPLSKARSCQLRKRFPSGLVNVDDANSCADIRSNFRLTRDLVDGLGPAGVQGVFLKSCEATMQVLRNGKDDLMTILEVLTRDPLYNWSVTPEKAARIQQGGEYRTSKPVWFHSTLNWFVDKLRTNVKGPKAPRSTPGEAIGSKLAETILLRVGRKLDGFDEGILMSVEGQVKTIIQQARDPDRLSQVFCGWQPYL